MTSEHARAGALSTHTLRDRCIAAVVTGLALVALGGCGDPDDGGGGGDGGYIVGGQGTGT